MANQRGPKSRTSSIASESFTLVILDDQGGDPLRSSAIPELRYLARLDLAFKNQLHFNTQFSHVVADELIGAFRYSHGTLGILAQCQAGHAEEGRLFLYAA